MRHPTRHQTIFSSPIRYSVHGEGRPVFLLHGWGANAQAMAPLVTSLAPQHRVYAIDLPGFGYSPPPPEAWTVQRYAEAIAELARREGIAEGLAAIGHSFGGRIALRWAADPQLRGPLERLVLLSAAGLRPRRTWRYYARRTAAEALKAPLRMLPELWRDRALDRLRRSALWRMLGSRDYRQAHGVMREVLVRTVTDHLDGLLPQIRLPTLILWGEQDRVTPLDQAYRLREGIAGALLHVIPQAGHHLLQDAPKTVCHLVREFLHS
ncbi:MAG: alpha/beta hydrolase [Bacteroidota bacterium]|nr:alpha/beta hydrolase [Rhodothermia bacterium]MDW8286155.1 alpha/beta hydrolase [Bacteroidota bacterium]